MVAKVNNIKFASSRKVDKPLLDKLNIVADKQGRTPTNAARHILDRACDEFIAKNNINLSATQPAVG